MDDSTKSVLTPKLLKYVEYVERQTKRKVKLEYLDGFNLPGTSFAFRLDTHYVCIGVLSGTNLQDPKAERSIAHEITHGLLVYGLGYYALAAKEGASDEEIQYLSLLSIIDDIVVNKTIQEYSFPAFGSTYYEMLNREIQAARRRVDIYDDRSFSTLFKRRYIACRHVLAWGVIEYCELDLSYSNLITEFLKVFQKAFSREYMVAKDIEELIIKNNIFSAIGHKKVIETVLQDWNLNSCCTLECYAS